MTGSNASFSEVITINSTTAGTTAMTISNLTISSPTTSNNVLSLTDPGTNVPLRISNTATISDGGILVISGGVVRVESSSTAFRDDGEIVLNASTAELVVTNGAAVNIAVASPGTLKVAGGVATFGGFLNIASGTGQTGDVWITGGKLVTTNAAGRVNLGNAGIGQVTISNGTWLAREVRLANSIGLSRGSLTIINGTNWLTSTLSVGEAALATGTVFLAGGQLVVTNASTLIGASGIGDVTMTNGSFIAQSVRVGTNTAARGTWTMFGGSAAVAADLIIGRYDCSSVANVSVAGGTLTVTNAGGTGALDVRGGTFTMSGGTVRADTITVTNACSRLFVYGGSFSGTTTNLTASLDADGDSMSNASDPDPFNPDDDGDGLPGDWEVTYGFDPLDATGVNGAAGDPDGDGLSNLEEYLGGTDPTTPNLHPNVNSWTFNSNGPWEMNSRWSSGTPSLSDPADRIENSSTKTVTIASSAPTSSLTITNLRVQGVGASTNTLLLTTTNTLVILNHFAVGTNAFVIVSNSNLRVDGKLGGNFLIDGTVTNAGGSIVALSNSTRTVVGNSASGNLTVRGGRMLLRDVYVATNVNSSGTLSIAGGTNALIGPLTVGGSGTGTVWVTGGQLVVTNNPSLVGAGSGFIVDGSVTLTNGSSIIVSNVNTIVGNAGSGSLIMAGGSMSVTNLVVGNLNGSSGTITHAGGTITVAATRLTLGASSGSTGTIWMTDSSATLVHTNDNLMVIGSNGVGQVTVSNGTWLACYVFVGEDSGSGTLTIAGGSTTLVGFDMIVGGPLGSGTGTVWVTGGQLTATKPGLGTVIGDGSVGQMTVSNGTWRAWDVTVGAIGGSRGTLTVAGGTNTLSVGLTVGNDPNANGAVWVTGGQLTVTAGTVRVGNNGVGQMTVSNGTWLARTVNVAANGGTTGRGTLTVAGGTSSVFLSLTIGGFPCTATGTVVIGGGNLFVTNATASAVLEVRTGSLILNSGLLTIDKLVMTNACGSFVHTGGTLVYGTAVLDPTRDDDGDGLPNGWEQSFGLDPLDATGDNGAAGDPDADGMNNLFEFTYGFNPIIPADAGTDPDGDGFTNLQEFQAGTDPTNSASALRITSITQVSGTNILITWMTGIGKTNALERTVGAAGSFATNNFAAIFTVTNAVGGVTNYLDLGAATNVPAFYYRVRLVP